MHIEGARIRTALTRGIVALSATAAIALALAGCVPSPTPTTTATVQPSPSSTPTAAPTIDLSGTAPENLPYFDDVNQALIAKGQRVVVTGRLRVRDWESGDRTGTTVELDADAIGHDLSWGTAVFTRSVSSALAQSDGDAVTASTAADDDDSADPEPVDEPAGAGAKEDADVAVPF